MKNLQNDIHAAKRRAAAVVLAAMMTLVAISKAIAATFTVTTTADAGAGSLREAITLANSTAGADIIEFNIPGPGPHTIQPLSALPEITDPVVIDGTSQPGYAGKPIIELDGSMAGEELNGLHITAGNSTVQGLVINRFFWDGIFLGVNGGNVVKGNYIGTDVTGTVALGNGSKGVHVNFSSNNTIGGTSAAARNILSGNHQGVALLGSSSVGNLVQGNFIGTDVSGTVALGNLTQDIGVDIVGASNNTIGGTSAGARNVISGNNTGIQIFGHEASGNKVQGNYIGTDVTGNVFLFNFTGVSIWISHNNLIGGTSAAARNVISGNKTGVGILDASGNQVQGNFIGTNANGTKGLGNTDDGVDIACGYNNIISDNVISANSSTGVVIRCISATGNLVQRNFIGTDKSGKNPLGNGEHGVAIADNASNNTIGGTNRSEGNVIAFNSPSGVIVHSSAGNAIISNSIFSNSSLGIDLDADGVTTNDAGDGDTGANNLQNFPVLSSAKTGAGDVTIDGTFNSTPNTSGFRLEFFSNTACDASNHGEGKTFIGFTTVNTDGSGNASFSVTFSAAVPVDAFITATATDPSNNTSEFSQCVEAVAKPFVLLADENVEISGQTNSDGDIHANNDIIFNEGNPSRHTGNLTAVDDIIIKKKNKIIGTAAGDDISNAGTVTGGITRNAGIAIIPLPTLPDLDAHGKDIKVANSKTRVLDPGNYGKIVVEAKGRLKLKSGDYNLYHLKTAEKAMLVIDLTSGQPITFNVDKRVVFGKHVVMKLIPPTASTTLITFNIDEDDDDGANDQGDVVMIGDSSRVYGNIIAPETSVEIGLKALFKGAICAENIRVKKGARFVHHSSTAAFPKESDIEESEDVSDQSPVISYQLEQNYPNPFNPSTKIQFNVLEAGAVQLTVYNLQGQEVRTLVSGQMNPGRHAITWNGQDNAGKIVPSGVYLYKLRVNGFEETRKMTFMK